MTLAEMISQVAQALASQEANKWGNKSHTESFATPVGSVAVCMSSERNRSYSRRSDATTVKTQLKLDGKVISKAALLLALGETRVASENAELKAAFLAKAPELAAQFSEFITHQYKNVAAKRDGVVPAYVEYRDPLHSVVSYLLRPNCRMLSSPSVAPGRNQDHILVLDAELLATLAKQYGERVALDWFHKTNAKLGDATDITLVDGDASNGELSLVAARGDRRISISQQCVLKHSPKGKLFHQFPARIYVDKQFTPEAVYKKMFA